MGILLRKSLVTATLMTFFYAPLCAQFSDSLKVSIGATTFFAAENYQPLWIEALQSGTTSHQKTDLATHVLVTNSHFFAKDGLNERPAQTNGFYIRYGIDLYNNSHFRDFFAKEAYVKAGYKFWEIRVGRFKEIMGEVDPTLSSGSFAVSGNSLPIPKVGLALTEYTAVPFTKGFLQLKGQFSHGWLGNTNYVKRAFLHEKSFYIKGGKGLFSLYGGLNHFANWAGDHPSGRAPSRFKDFLRIVAGAAGDSEDPVYHQGPVDIANAVGNHMITSDIGIEINSSASILKVYTQTIFEKGKGDSSNLNKRDKLVGLNIFGKDRLVGISWETRKPAYLQKVLLEGVYTKHQGGPIIFNGRFNYYNNATYATGWEYKDHIIGTPLFINRRQASTYNLDPASTTGWNIVSNRVVGFHVGLTGNINQKLSYITLITHVRHYGNYYNDALFAPSKPQSNLLLEIKYRLSTNVLVNSALALDQGHLSNNKGGKLGVEWRVK